jgi:hypothetical protein
MQKLWLQSHMLQEKLLNCISLHSQFTLSADFGADGPIQTLIFLITLFQMLNLAILLVPQALSREKNGAAT